MEAPALKAYKRKLRKKADSAERSRKIKYGLAVAQYERLMESQGGVCAICEGPPVGDSFHVDHDHRTGKVRGLLCLNCNVLLGHAKDSRQVLERAVAYLGQSSDS